MEAKQAIKPPWVVSASAWQRKRQHLAPLIELSFSPWSEDAEATTLMAAKAKISALEASRRWELIKKMVNPYEMVYTHEDAAFHPSISMIRPLSRSYYKMIEMLHVMQFFEGLSKQNPKLRTAHVAEGPGGFIQAVVELASRHKKILTKATAMTLRPTDQYVPGWRRAATFLHQHKEVKLMYGPDNTGDIYRRENQAAFAEAVTPGAHLFTADGGFDFSINYNMQERRVFRLLASSASVGLRSLMHDGAMVLKIFDVYSESTRILLILLSRCFKEWMLYKPALSRPCNSERYFLGKGFAGAPPKVIELLEIIQQRSLREEYPTGFDAIATEEEKEYFKEHIRENTQLQLAALTKADEFIVRPEQWYEVQLPKDFETSLRWCHEFRVPPQMVRPIMMKPPSHLKGGQTSSLCGPPQSQSPGDGSGCLVPSSPA
jgi:23S rRNA U2552 (ribose-2'-O)-methylase RlmE/FtsJ